MNSRLLNFNVLALGTAENKVTQLCTVFNAKSRAQVPTEFMSCCSIMQPTCTPRTYLGLTSSLGCNRE